MNEIYLDIKGLKANNTGTINRCRAKLANSAQVESFSSSDSSIAKTELYNWSGTTVTQKRLVSQVG
ncbi:MULTISPECIES: hypothetical protein [Okeania]|uniref:Uncharacterized protein n=1 Tax=Okeania hirsuta TaxID=1458930 RepID=A0A3N6Q1M0_9CYAN|nr:MULTISPECIES: hypothetical protein [Okeania]NES77051.1 hypothetical protein [Okeania sp. SIO1H4]NES89379.1 hypothetical protein [Okeania sp. SIO2B9]NET18546.1 hypothetical protein [Okeania sp. SIO1H5]NET76655.1 hypothetical protein [Okeania sp. SIO1F9]NET94889.1 hypothetical protein [Okeania sp. SIO1H2]